MKVAVVAGEASGDRQAASLLRHLNDLIEPGDSIEAWGIGGRSLHDAGCDIILDSSSWGTIGVVESTKQLFSLLFAMEKFKREFLARTPDLLILVDFGAFNIPLAKWVKSRYKRISQTSRALRHGQPNDVPICYYFPPSSWRRKMNPKSLRNLTEVTDIVFTPFPWSAELLKSVGGNAQFVGHPLLDTVKSTLVSDEFDKTYGLDSQRSVITLLPGSREHEIKYILPVMLGAAGEIARRLPGVQFLVACADNLPRALIEKTLREVQEQNGSADLLHLAQHAGDLLKYASSALKPPVAERVTTLATPEGLLVQPDDQDLAKKPWVEHTLRKSKPTAPLAIVSHATIDAMARADLVIAASGTATLEAAILGKPEIIMYRGSSLMNVEYKLRRKALNISYIGLPNILADSGICPEFLQEDANVQSIANEALDLLLQPERLLRMRATLAKVVKENLGEPGATRRTAMELIKFLDGRTSARMERSAGSSHLN